MIPDENQNLYEELKDTENDKYVGKYKIFVFIFKYPHKIIDCLDFQQKLRHRQICFASLHNKKKDNNTFKSKNQPELPEN